MKAEPTTKELIEMLYAEMLYARHPEIFHKPKREWVGLTGTEKHELRYSHMTSAEFIDAIEAKLKEKNT